MKSTISILSSIAILLFTSCNTELENNQTDNNNIESTTVKREKDVKAENILKKIIEAHGGDLYDDASYSFVFRKKQYTFQNDKSNYTYRVKGIDEKGAYQGKEVYDVLKNGTLTRKVDGAKINLSQTLVENYSGVLNSVIYFATLPHKLQDKSVIKSYKGNTSIRGEKYEVLEVTFEQEGGGQDHNDEFHYWVNTETNVIDYLAYNYRVNKGGVRFRSAYNSRVIDGIRFQDYVNYEAKVGTLLIDLPTLYEKGELKELSRIETENITNLNK